MELYGLLLFVHIVAVILWLGPSVVFLVLTERAARSDDPGRIRTLIDVSKGLGNAYFGVVTIVVLASGLWLVFQADWGFDDLFIIGGLAGLVTSAGIGGVVFGPASERLEKSVGGATTIDGELRSEIIRLRNAGRVDSAILLLVVFLMTVKPGS